MIGNPQAIGPTPAQAPKYGLLVAADLIVAEEVAGAGVEQEAPREWAQGVRWAPEQFNGGGIVGLDCMGRTPDGFNFGDNPVENTAEPFVVYAADECNTFPGRDPEGRARRQLEATQSYHIAREFQLGTLRDADGLDNVALEDAVPLTSPATATPVEALAALEAAISDRFYGARAMIHATPQTLTHLLAAQAIYLSGNKWLSALGSIIVADAGYGLVEGDTTRMYATGLVRVRLGGVLILTRTDTTDRATNLSRVVAERLALVQVDSTETGTVADPDAMFRIDVDIDPWAVS